MAVSKRTWYTNKERKAEAAALGLDTKAKGWSAAADASLEAKGVKPRSAWIVDYRDKDRTRQTETFATKTEAEKRHAQVVVDMSRNMHVAPNKSITFNEAAALFIEACKGRKLERTTIQSYELEIAHLRPLVGACKLVTFGSEEACKLRDKLRETCSPVTGKPNSQIMVRRIITTLSGIFADAVERGKIPYNPIANLSRKHNKSEAKRSSRHQDKVEIGVNVPSDKEVEAIIRHAPEPRYQMLFAVAAFTGLRSSELRGLRWDNVNFTKNQIQVRERADKFSTMGKPKSGAGKRNVPLPHDVATALKEWRLRTPGEYVFPAQRAAILSLAEMVRALHNAGRAAGLVVKWKPESEDDTPPAKIDKHGMVPKYTGMHTLRHFHASWCISPEADGGLGMSPKAVQERMGHSKISVTLDIYGHLFPRGDDGGALDRGANKILGGVKLLGSA